MNRFATSFLILLLCVPTAFAASGGASRVVSSVSSGASGANASSRATGDTTAGREVSRVTPAVPAVTNRADPIAATAVRSTVSRVFAGNSDTSAPGVPVRVVSDRAAPIVRAVSSGRTARLPPVAPAVMSRDVSVSLRPSRVRAATGDQAAPTTETVTDATLKMEETATLNRSCQAQYNECMDQFCNVVNANQGRCSCSANLANYEKSESAVKEANTQLNEVAQRIRYVGLSADEIRAIMNETEAEAVLSGSKDTSDSRDMLAEIEDLISDPVSSTSYSSDTYSGFDLDLDFSSESADLFSLDFLNTDSVSGFSNLRGAELYKAAKNRCKSILTRCKEAGATSNQITGNYDLAIDRDCVAYEQGLVKMNDALLANVRSANLMLQKARLAVRQNKNMYDAKGCIGALETCMTDEMVCGADYFKCVDPTKRYIDENGNVVLGQKISNIQKFMAGYINAIIDADFLSNAYGTQQVSDDACGKDETGIGGNDASCVVKYLLQKIGTKQKVTDEGLCRAVLDKCQEYTYDSNENYRPFNDIVVNYVQRALVNIRAAQRRVVADYAAGCMLSIAECYNQQVSQVNSWVSNASVDSVRSVMRGACRNVALTCAYAIFDSDKNSCPANDSEKCIDSISEMFYQSLLCPDNSVYQTTASSIFGNGTNYVNARCKCIDGYEPFGSLCVAECSYNSTRAPSGACTCNTGYTMKNGKCVESEAQ